MKIAILLPKSNFTKLQQKQLAGVGDVVYLERPIERPLAELMPFVKGAAILAIDPDNFGGFEKAKEQLTKLLDAMPQLKALALDTTSYGWVDLEYCRQRRIPVCNVPGYSRESVAEHTLALLLCLAKRIITTDRKTQKGEYKLEMGFELKGKTLGVIGLGNIGSRTAELGLGIGMKVIAYNRSPKKQKGVIMKSLNQVLKESNALVLHITHTEKNKGFIGKRELGKMKKGVIMVNTADRDVVDEQAMAEAIRSGRIMGYAYEAEDLLRSPLAKVENAVGLKGFGWYTKEAMENLMQIWVDNIIALACNKPLNTIT